MPSPRSWAQSGTDSMGASRAGRVIEGAARALAWCGGAIMAALSVLTVVSILGRALDGLGLGAIPGDYELMAHGCGIAVFFFLPWCQLKRGHVTVDIVTERFPPRVQALFGLFGDALITFASVVILRQLWFAFGQKFPFGSDTLRGALGLGHRPFYVETTYELQLPLWIPYALALVGAAMMVVVGLYTVLRAAIWVRAGQEGRV
ncbi:TRAP transporter small permease [Tropicimonas sp. IMCC34043]|uniref:TRAP transporter small permease n=1 Tax=Tropicimonas sp. IMCC34043 TaxID=2248760 RepID=UPI0018E5190C|nr:TRAP transporter small permease [Tropicimonas sp. IMCC34043]